MSPQTGSHRYTYGPEVVYGDISIQYITLQRLFIFLFSIFFLCVHKKYKNANKRIMQITQITFFLLDVLKHILNFCSLACILCFCLVVFLCFLCIQNLFVKKKEFKTALITSFILLLTFFIIFKQLSKKESFNKMFVDQKNCFLFQVDFRLKRGKTIQMPPDFSGVYPSTLLNFPFWIQD